MTPNFYHKELADGRWQELSFVQQMANVGSELERAIKWKNKNKPERSQLAFLEHLNLWTLQSLTRRILVVWENYAEQGKYLLTTFCQQ